MDWVAYAGAAGPAGGYRSGCRNQQETVGVAIGPWKAVGVAEGPAGGCGRGYAGGRDTIP